MSLCGCHGVQSAKMILKFRETHIGNMEKQRRGKGGEEVQVTLERSRPGGTVNGLVSGDGLTTSVGLSCMFTWQASIDAHVKSAGT